MRGMVARQVILLQSGDHNQAEWATEQSKLSVAHYLSGSMEGALYPELYQDPNSSLSLAPSASPLRFLAIILPSLSRSSVCGIDVTL